MGAAWKWGLKRGLNLLLFYKWKFQGGILCCHIGTLGLQRPNWNFKIYCSKSGKTYIPDFAHNGQPVYGHSFSCLELFSVPSDLSDQNITALPLEDYDIVKKVEGSAIRCKAAVKTNKQSQNSPRLAWYVVLIFAPALYLANGVQEGRG
jgi:hypothetical protein